jgi:hypothetical protein
MIRRPVVVFSLFLVSALACGAVPPGPAGPAAASPTGEAALNVRGALDRGAASYPCPPGDPCDPPIQAMFVVFSQPGKPDIRTQLDPGGAFALHLDPGSYSVSAAPSINGRVQPSQVRVPSAGTLQLQLQVVRPQS